jgi:hypothetical protein
MVELSKRKKDISGDGGNHHEELGLGKSSCASQLTIADKAGKIADQAGNITDTGSFKPYQARCTPDFS